jgi:hypothetical protein
MAFFDFLFGDENVRAAMKDKSYLDPSGITDPTKKTAALEAADRMDWSRGLGAASQAISAANAKGGKWGDLLAAGAGGLTQGSDDLMKQRLLGAQTRQAMAHARKYEAEAKGGQRPPVVRDANGRVWKWNGKRYVGTPEWEQDRYGKVDLPTMPYDYNDDQKVVDPQGAKAGGTVPTYVDTTTGKTYKWIGGKWVEGA